MCINNVAELVRKSQQKDDSATLELIEKYKPLLLKYAVKLHYEDAYSDLLEKYLRLIKSIKLNKLAELSDAVLTSYIAISVRHDYIRLSKKNQMDQVIAPLQLSEKSDFSYGDYWDHYASSEDSYNFEKEINLPICITEHEKKILIDLFVYQLRTKEIAENIGVSSQAITMAKKNAIKKLKQQYNIKD